MIRADARVFPGAERWPHETTHSAEGPRVRHRGRGRPRRWWFRHLLLRREAGHGRRGRLRQGPADPAAGSVGERRAGGPGVHNRYPIGQDPVQGRGYHPYLGRERCVPGPTIRARRGEQVEFVVRNGLDQGTSLHWHGAHLPAVMGGGPHQVPGRGDLAAGHCTAVSR
ncbi:multicopper oxidase domain-containing protein [Streptomyces kunmingensis]|uniref:multicopper oxidase domain-containing protein n=1 Tax=Streptomyces kunmingensis TaxID=68225 RepID=UPI0031E38BA2